MLLQEVPSGCQRVDEFVRVGLGKTACVTQNCLRNWDQVLIVPVMNAWLQACRRQVSGRAQSVRNMRPAQSKLFRWIQITRYMRLMCQQLPVIQSQLFGLISPHGGQTFGE